MNLTALRPFSKLKKDVLQNSCRLFSFKFEMTPNRTFQENPEETPFRNAVDEQVQQVENSNFRYNVCQPRTSPIERPSTAGDVVAAQKQTVKAAIEQQHLQPSMLPEYYQKQMEKNALISPEPELNEENRINSGGPVIQRRFQVSKTYANAILPLKSVKLANPFPEPVKMMMSRTVSDDEKAEQMLADSRSQRNYPNQGTAPSRNLFTEVKRWYSKTVGTDSDKCKKTKTKGKKGCPKMVVPNCPPPARTKCDRFAKHIECKKQESPYPAYSEFCHEEIDEKPSECKLCPWQPEDNPNFKQPKKKFHTSACTRQRRTGLETEWTQYSRKMGEEPVVFVGEDQEGMLCDLRKPKCEKPKNRRCPPTKEEKLKKEKKKKPKEKECQSQNQPQEKLELEEDEEIMNEYVISLKKKPESKKPSGNCKVRKFKFPDCKHKQKKEEEVHDPCARKKKKRKIIDCPPADDKVCSSRGLEGIVEEYAFDKKKKKDNQKCPKVDLTVDEAVLEESACPPRKTDRSKICPGDLLKKKKRKPTKKASDHSSVFTPNEAIETNKKEPPQPRTRII